MPQVTADSVAETSTSTGTGDMVLSGAIAGHRAFSSKAADTNQVAYRIEAVDSNGNATGDWETGIGTYNSAANSITRSRVANSSNSDNAVNFSAGTKRVYLTLLSLQMYRENGRPFKLLEKLSPGFDPLLLWAFASSDEGWTSTNTGGGTVAFDSSNGRGLLVTDISTSIAFFVKSPANLSIDGGKFRRAKMSVTITSSPSTGFGSSFAPVIQYTTSGHGFSSSHQKSYPAATMVENGEEYIYDFDMDTSTNPTDWQTSIITQIQFFVAPTSLSGMVQRINWIAVGEARPSRGSIKRMRMIGLR